MQKIFAIKVIAVLTVFQGVILALGASAMATAKLDPSLVQFVRAGNPNAKVRVVVVMTPPATESAPRKYDRVGVINYLRRSALESWNQVGQSLSQQKITANDFHRVRLFAVNASFTADVTANGIRALGNAPTVSKIYFNGKIELVQPRRGRMTPPTEGQASNPYDYVDTGLDKLISEKADIDGTGVLLGHIDTGVDGKHPALAGKIAMFYDAGKKQRVDPYDSDTHGTHTAGTMVGGDRTSNRIGMAPGAKLISSGMLADYDQMLASMEFMLNPDGNPGSKFMPRAISNSWNTGGAPDQELFYRAISAWDAAGILPVFSAGNSGPGPSTITPPHENPMAFAIGATGEDGKITGFSSRGPGNFKGQKTQKPDITAPGNNIRSSVPGGGYEEMSGTSMACPHVTGMTALLFQVNPALTPDQTRALLIKTAVPRDQNGNPAPQGTWNPVYGYGKLDIYNAVKMAAGMQVQRLMQMTSAISFLSPEEQDEQDLNQMQPDQADVYSFPKELEGSDWVSMDKI